VRVINYYKAGVPLRMRAACNKIVKYAVLVLGVPGLLYFNPVNS